VTLQLRVLLTDALDADDLLDDDDEDDDCKSVSHLSQDYGNGGDDGRFVSLLYRFSLSQSISSLCYVTVTDDNLLH